MHNLVQKSAVRTVAVEVVCVDTLTGADTEMP